MENKKIEQQEKEELVKITEIPETPFKYVERKDTGEKFIALGNIKLSDDTEFEEINPILDSWQFKINLIAGIVGKMMEEINKYK